jgi:small-conductance mechanosensitive channel
VIAGAVLTAMLVLPVPAASQEVSAASQSQAEPAPETIPIGRIPSRHEELDERLANVRKTLGDSARPQIEAELAAFRSGVERSSTTLDALLVRERPAASDLEEQRVEWNALGRRARRWQTELGDSASQIDARLEEVDALRELWQRTQAAARERRAPEVTLERISSALSSLDETQRLLEAERKALLVLEERINAQTRTIATTMGRIVEAQDAVRAALFIRGAPPIWELRASELASDLPLVGEALNAGISRSRRYIEANAGALLGQLLLIAALWFALRRAREAFEGAGEEDPITRSANASAFAHPAAAAWLVGIGLTRAIHPEAPRTFAHLLLLTALVPWLVVLQSMLPPTFHRHVRTLAGLAALLVIYTWTSGVEILSQLLLLTLIALTFVWLLLLRRPARLAELPPSLREGAAARFLAAWLRITTFVVAFALAAALVGFGALAEMGMLVALGGNFTLSSFVAAAGILEALLTVGLGRPALSSLRMLNTRRRLVLRVLSRVVHLVMAGAFVFAMLSVVGVAEPVVRLIVGILTAEIGYGVVQLSLNGVLAFVATLWISFKLGRLVTFVFDEEVVPRVHMAPGVPYAIGTFARYLIIVFGFVIAVAMLGFQMDRLALLVSALGVGIGFGLQNVVNNFVSGIIMLFERPIRVGDRVQLDDLLGEVTSIGIRASRVNTVDGSDVIVPNAEFISTRVINWTLSDYKRRLMVPIGVRYGTDPEQVLELLLEAAREHEEVMADPEPVSLFRAHGDSSLNFELRAFTESPRGWLAVMSDLTVSINRKLKEAGIEIPFPQRDLHLRSADVEAARTLRGE